MSADRIVILSREISLPHSLGWATAYLLPSGEVKTETTWAYSNPLLAEGAMALDVARRDLQGLAQSIVDASRGAPTGPVLAARQVRVYAWTHWVYAVLDDRDRIEIHDTVPPSHRTGRTAPFIDAERDQVQADAMRRLAARAVA